MKLEVVFHIRLGPEDQKRLAAEGMMSLDQALGGAAFIERRLPAHSEEARRLEEELAESGVEFYVREERHFSERELHQGVAVRLDSFHRSPQGLPSVASAYDWSEVCSKCMRVPTQTGHLVVPARATGGRPVFRGRRGEIVVCESIARAMIREGISGCLLREVRVEGDDRGSLPSYFQILPTHRLPRLVSPPTRFALSSDVCTRCGVGGLLLESMLFLDIDAEELEDFNVTSELFGEGACLSPEVVVSSRLFRVFEEAGARFEEAEPVLFV